MKFTSTTTFMAVMASSLTGTALAKTLLGGIDVELACKQQNAPNWRQERIGDHWGDWKCRGPNGEWRDVNMNAACADQWGWPEAWAEHGSSVWSWKCYH